MFKTVQGLVKSVTTCQQRKFSKFLQAITNDYKHVADQLTKDFNTAGLNHLVTGQFPKREQCKCKGKCDTKRCNCRKNSRPCRRSSCDCSIKDCLNLESEEPNAEESGESEGECSSSVMSESRSAESRASSGVKMQCTGETYDPVVHNAMWHSANPFVLEEYRRKLKKCQGCELEFASTGDPDNRFVISHGERREFWRNRARNVVSRKAFYHCSASCICSRHPYFKPSEVAASPALARKLTLDDVQFIKQNGIDLSFLRV